MSDPAETEILATACPHDCPSTCALEVERLAPDRIGRVRGAETNSYTAGVVCAKVARYAERVHHPDRLTQPLKRIGAKGEGKFAPISWDEALDETAAAFLEAERAYGSESVWPYYYAGTMGLVHRDGINRLRHAKKYSGQNMTVCTALSFGGWVAGTGALRGADPREMADSDLVVIWGTNPVHTQVNVMTHVTRARKGRGARMFVVDPYRNPTAEAADMHLCLRPGTDGALACAVMHVLFQEGLADRDYLATYTSDAQAFEAHLADRDPEWAAAITGLEAGQIRDFARAIGTTPKTFLRLGYGFTRNRNGAVNMHAATSIAAVAGLWRHRGGGAFHNNGAIYHWDKTLIEGLDVRDPAVRVLDQSRIGPILTGDRGDIGDGPPVAGLLIQNTNPVMIAPETNKVRAGFARDDLFTCVHEQFLTETAAYADIVLPATTFLEHDDLYQSGGHNHIFLGPRVIEPLGDCRSNHWVICELAKRLGADHAGFAMSERQIIDATLTGSGWPGIEELERERWIDCQPDFETAHYLNGFANADGRFHFAPDWSAVGPDADGLPRFPDHWEVLDDKHDDRPYRMVTAPARNFLNSTFTETPTSQSREGRPTVMLHPRDAATIGVDDGALVTLGNPRGEVKLHAELFDGVQPGVVVVESIWPNAAFVGGVGINALTGADAAKPAGGAAFHDTAVWIAAAQ